jgi:ABC-type branched-subunit amino acid transport system substrate-binding protein
MNVLNLLRLAVVSIIAALLSASAFAQKKESKEIVIGHVAGYTGPVTKDATELGEGAQVYFDAINARGGVLGRQIKFLKIDDHFKGDETVKELLALKGKVAAVMPPVGSAQFTQALKEGVVEKVDYPILGTIPGIESFRDPLRRNLFHYRAGDYDQIQKMIELTTSVGQNKVGVLATDNPNGEQVIAFMSDQLAKKNLKLAAVAKYVIGPKIDWAPMIKVYQQAQPDMILLVGPPFATAAFIKEAKVAGVSSTLFGLSYTDFRLAAKVAGNQLARGVAITQVFPSPANRVVPIIKEFRDNFEKYSKVQGVPSAFNLEGYIGAKILVEAIRRSKDASGPGTLRGLEMLKDWDMGGYVVDFSPTKHTGSRFVDMSMIGATGDLIY